MITRKPPGGLRGAPVPRAERHLGRGAQRGQAGILRQAPGRRRRDFPANVNVAAALSLAGIGPDRTMIEIWADPARRSQLPHHRSGQPTRRVSPSRSRTSPRKIPKRDGSPPFRSWQPCASCMPLCELEPELIISADGAVARAPACRANLQTKYHISLAYFPRTTLSGPPNRHIGNRNSSAMGSAGDQGPPRPAITVAEP